MPQIDKFKASIVNTKTGTAFEEFKPNVNKENTRTECYVECQTGTEFKVVFGLDSRFEYTLQSFVARVILDGKPMAAKFLGQLDGKTIFESAVEGVHTSESRFVTFAFGDTLFTEGVGNADNETLAGLGTIVVDFYNVQVLDGSAKTRHFPGGDSAGGKRSINEKTKKALITHSVKLGNPVKRTAPTNIRNVRYLTEAPSFTVTFHYRTRQILEAMEIITPKEISDETPPSCNDLSSEEGRSDEQNDSNSVEKIKKLKAEIQMLKRKIKDEPRRGSSEILDLTSGELRKKRRVVVDLTES